MTNSDTGAGAVADYGDLGKLQYLLTVVIDSRNGYKEALNETKKSKIATLFSRMLDLKERHIEELEALFRERGAEPDENGSFLTTVNKAILTFKAIFGGVNESVIPGLVDGETRIVGHYSEAIAACDSRRERQTLTKLRLELTEAVGYMRAMKRI